MAALVHIDPQSLKCRICSKLMSDPKKLSCTHTFCKECLSCILTCSTQTTANLLACPICQKPTIVDDGNVDKLGTNDLLKAHVDGLKNDEQLCDICDTILLATHFCCECDKNMCASCLNGHNKFTLEHTVESVEDIREGRVVPKRKIFCKEHKPDEDEQVCTEVCLTCKKLICVRCRWLNHQNKGHTVVSAEEYKMSIEKKMESFHENTKTKMKAINQVKQVTNLLVKKKDQINKIYKQSLDKLNKRKEELDEQLETKRVKVSESLDEMKIAGKRLVTSIDSASKLVGNSLRAPLDDDTVHIHDSLFNAMEYLIGRDDPTKVAPGVADRAVKLIFIQKNTLKIGEVQFLKCELAFDVALSNKGEMAVMTPTPDGRMAVGYLNGGVDIFSADGQLQDTVLEKILVSDLQFLSDGEHVVLNASHKIALYTLEWKNMRKNFKYLKGDDDQDECSSLTVDSNDLIYISYWKARKIHVFSPRGGKAFREIPCNGYVPAQMTSYKDLLVVTDDGGTIRVLNKTGNVKHSVEKPGLLAHAAVTKTDSILIAWVNPDDGLVSIDEYTNELKHIKTLISDHKIEKTERDWYYLQEFRSGEIAFCTPDRLFIFKLTITPIRV